MSGAPKLEEANDPPRPEPATLKDDVARLEAEVAALKALVERIAGKLGI